MGNITQLYFILLIFIAVLIILCVSIPMTMHWILKRNLKEMAKIINKVDRLSNLNSVTGLPNYQAFLKNCGQFIHKAKSKKQRVILLYLDLNNFKVIQDTLGHSMSDLLLVELATRLLVLFKGNQNQLAHLSLDQFCIVLLVDPQESTKNTIVVIDKILSVLHRPLLIEDHEMSLSITIGVAQFPEHGKDPKALLKCAGIARFFAKQLGNNQYCFYIPGMDTQTNQNRVMLNYLSRAVERKELVVCFQPKIDIFSRKIIGAEALLEWHSPELGKVSPSIFIPLAEQAGLIASIGEYVLKEACKQTKIWHEQGFNPFTIAINLSAFQFKAGDIAEHIANMIWEIQLNPDYLELEITESMIMENIEKSLLMFKVLKTMGIRISLDDFGTGYSSLSQLKTFPIDSLKIDQSFIRPLTTFEESNGDCAMVSTIIAMAKQLGIKVIAEGVETEEQFQFLKQAGADYAQGYLFSKPISADKFVLLLQQDLNTANNI